MRELKFQDSKYKSIALYYGICAVIGVVLITYQLLSSSLNWLVFLLYALVYSQTLLMLVGAINYWNRKRSGLKILFWMSLSLIPAIYTPLIAYILKISSDLFIYYESGFGANRIGFDFFVFYNTTLRLFNEEFWRFGFNIIEFFIFLRLLNIAKSQNISMPPLKNSSNYSSN